MAEIKCDKLVLFYNPTCKHSKDFMTVVWKYFVNNYKNSKNIVIEQVNCDLSSAPELSLKYKIEKIEGSPTLVFFQNKQAFVYHGIRSINSIEKFLADAENSEDAESLIYSPDKDLFCQKDDLYRHLWQNTLIDQEDENDLYRPVWRNTPIYLPPFQIDPVNRSLIDLNSLTDDYNASGR